MHEWTNQWKTSEEKTKYIDENNKIISDMFSANGGCENDVLMKGSEVFSEYTRLKKNFDFYYG